MLDANVYNAIIVGSGFGGLGQAAELRRNGITNFAVLEKSTEIGGVWRDNTYPGVACDTQSLIYCFSYDLHLDVSAMYAPGNELWDYLRRFITKFGLESHIQTDTEVIEAKWDTGERIWRIQASNGQQYLSRSMILACGQLGHPYTPEIPDAEFYQGETFHASRWRHDIDLTGKRVASIGSAATAIQYIPEIASQVAELTVYQRSANYILPRNQQVFSPEQQQEFLTNPSSYQRLREEIHQMREEGFARTLTGTEEASEGVRMAQEHLYTQIADPQLRQALTPDYAYGCKRILRSDDFYPALNRPNVELVTEKIAGFTRGGLRTAQGEVREHDVIIYATGFHSHRFHGDIHILGSRGESLSQRWGNTPEAYLGVTVDGFPNMFIVYGPNTNLNHNSVISMLEIQHSYIRTLVHKLKDQYAEIQVTQPALRAFNETLQSELERSAYSADCSSWYKNEEGKVINNWSRTVEDYRSELSRIRWNDYSTVSS